MMNTLQSSATIRDFDCAICRDSLKTAGPPLEAFTFGKLILMGHTYFGRGFDSTKVVTTKCGHMFHAGCIREWFFTQKEQCPFCSQACRYDECHVVHGVSCTGGSTYDSEEEDSREPYYSDISSPSSTWSTTEDDDEYSGSEDSLYRPDEYDHDQEEPGQDEDIGEVPTSSWCPSPVGLASILQQVDGFSLFSIALFGIIAQTQRYSLHQRILECQYQEQMHDEREDEDYAENCEDKTIPLGYHFIIDIGFVWFIILTVLIMQKYLFK